MNALSRAVIATLLPGAMMAQAVESTPPRSIHGVVFDSVGRAVLSGAVVQAALIDSTSRARKVIDAPGRVFTAITDTTGGFHLSGLPSGRFAVTFQHDALNALAIDASVRVVDLTTDTSALLDLAIPSSRTVRQRLCPNARYGPDDAMLAGYVLDASTGTALHMARLEVRWMVLDIRRSRLKPSLHRASPAVDDGGRYRVCGIPTDVPVTVHIAAEGLHDVDAELMLPEGAAVRQDFRLVDASALGGSARIALRVVDDAGSPVTTGRAVVPELSHETPIDSGTVVIGDLPSGTWVILLRGIGYEPAVSLLDASPNSAPVTVSMTRVLHELDTVRVQSDIPGSDREVLREAANRMLLAGGTLIRPDNPSLASAVEASDALKEARGFRWRSSTDVEGREYEHGACRSLAADGIVNGGQTKQKVIALYLDGARYPGGLEMINRAVPPNRILAIEAYPDVSSAPFLWRTNDACAVVAFWTKH